MKNKLNFIKVLLIALTALSAISMNAQPLTANIRVNGISVKTVNACIGDVISLDGAPSGGSYIYVSHQWLSQLGQISPLNTQSVTYSVSSAGQGNDTIIYNVTDDLGAVASDTLIITFYPPPVPCILMGNPVVCKGSTETYTTQTGKINYQWTVSGGTIISGTGTNSITVLWGSNSGYVCIIYDDTTYCPPTAPTCENITVNIPQTPTLTGDTLVCMGSAEVYCTDAGMVAYNWSVTGGTIVSGQGNDCITVNWNGSAPYQVCAVWIDGNGCSPTPACSTVTIYPVPAVTAGPDPTICAGSCANLNASGGVTYNWSNNLGTNPGIVVCPVSTTTYTVTATDANGCPATDDVTVTVMPQLSLSIIPTNVLCFGSSTGAANLTVSGGTPGYSYSWSNGTTTQDLINIPSGTYSVIVTDGNGCTATGSTTITQPAAPISVSIISPNIILCDGDATTFCATPTGGTPPYSYLWSTGDTSQTIYAPVGVMYNVTVTDANGCIELKSAIHPVSKFVTSISKTDVACFGDSTGSIDLTVTGGMSALTYLWSNGATTEDISNLTAGNYSVTVSDINGCSASVSDSVKQPSIPLTLIATPVHVLCYGDSTGEIDLIILPFYPTNNYSYVIWCNGYSMGNAAYLAAGNYTVIVTDSSGCTATASTIINQPPPYTDTIIKTNASCFTCSDGSAQVNASGGTPPYYYNWNTGATTTNISGLSPGKYLITITDTIGCTKVDSVIISSGSCLAAFGVYPDTVIAHHYYVVNNAAGTPPIQYNWSWGDGSPNDTAAYPTHTYATSGFYDICLSISDATGCIDTYCHNFYLQKNTNDMISVEVIAAPVGISEIQNENNFSIFPNPAKELLSVEYKVQSKSALCKVYDILGEEIISKSFTENKFSIDVSKLAKGLYLLKVENENGVAVRRFIKE